MKQKEYISARCPIRTTLEMLGGKWRLLIINAIGDQSKRYGEIRTALPDISEKMLAQELSILVDNDILIKNTYNEVPPKVEYQLTENGFKALELLEPIRKFGLEYQSKLKD